MSRKDFNRLADALNAIRPPQITLPLDYAAWWECVRTVADVCEGSNDRFNRDLFIQVCEHGA